MSKPIDHVLAKFEGARKNGAGWKCRCPAHDDQNPSLSIDEAEDGTVLIKCRANCDTSAVLSAVGLTMKDLFPTTMNGMNKASTNSKPRSTSTAYPSAAAAVAELERSKGKRSATWTYTNAAGEPVGVVVRWDTSTGKEIRPVSRHSDGWRICAMPEPRPLYNLPELADADLVVVCEGEKCAVAASSIGFTATTSAGGSGAGHLSDWSPLAGKTVLLSPDNDAPGDKFVATVASKLAALKPAPTIKIVRLPGLAAGGDIVDFIAARPDAKAEDLRAEIERLAVAYVVDSKSNPPATATNSEPEPWEPPTPLPERPPVPAFPIHLFPRVVREYWEAKADRVNGSLDILGALGVAALGTAVGRSIAGEIAWDYSRSPIVWIGAVGPSGTAKTSLADVAFNPLRDWDLEKSAEYVQAMAVFEEKAKCYREQMKEWEKGGREGDQPEQPTKPVHAISVVENVTLETLPGLLKDNPKGSGMLRDEFGSFLLSMNQYKGGAGSDRAEYLRLWSGEGSFSSTRGGSGERSHKIAQHCFLSMGGTLTPADAVQFATGTVDGKGVRHDGFAERFLIAWPDAKKAIPLRRLPSMKEAKDNYESFVRKLLTLPMKQVVKQVGVEAHVYEKPHTIKATAEAFREWERHDKVRCDRLNALDDGDPFRGWISKMSNNALAFATLFYSLDLAEEAHLNGQAIPIPPTGEIEKRHVAAGWELVEYFYGHALRVWGNSPLAEQLRRAKSILEKLNAHKSKQTTWTRANIHKLVDQQAWAKDRPPSELDKPLALLVEYGYLRESEAPRGRGRPTTRFEFNPCPPDRPQKDRGEIPGDDQIEEKPLENDDFDPRNIAPVGGQTGVLDRADIPVANLLENKAKTNGEPSEMNFAPVFDPPMGISGSRRRSFGPATGIGAKGGPAS